MHFTRNKNVNSYFLIPKSRDLVSHNPGISRLKNAVKTQSLLAMQSAVLAKGIPSVCPSVTFRYCVQMNEDMIVRFSASGRTIPLVFIRIPPTGALKWGIPLYTVFQKRWRQNRNHNNYDKSELNILLAAIIIAFQTLKNGKRTLQTLQISTKSTAQVLSNSCLFYGTQKQKFPIWKSRLSSLYTIPSVTVCAQSGHHLHRHLHVSCGDRSFSAAAGLPVCRPCSINLPQKSVQCWTRPVLVRKFLQQLSGTVTLTLPWNFDQYSVLFSKNHCLLRQPLPNASQKCNQHYVIIRNTFCSKYANRYFPYWKIMFLSSISYSDLNFGVTFLEHSVDSKNSTNNRP